MIGLVGIGLCLFAFGGLLLMLFLGARSIETEIGKRTDEESRVQRGTVRIRRLLRPARPVPGAEGADEVVFSELRQHLEQEQIAAHDFVSRPSMESLYTETEARRELH